MVFDVDAASSEVKAMLPYALQSHHPLYKQLHARFPVRVPTQYRRSGSHDAYKWRCY